MGSQEERDWVDVANDLLSKCHISLRLAKVTDCGAGVFVALYQAILGEKVPDYIAVPRSQEDDVHNVQSVIDSLALDYLQISLSHITGENVVRGDKESIKNLLEIFDGLLEYLTEQVSEEELADEGEPDHTSSRVGTSTERQLEQLERLSQTSSVPSTTYSSKHSDGSESTAELIRLGDSARTFMASQEERINGVHHADSSWSRLEVEAPQDRVQELASLPVGLVSTGASFPDDSSPLKEPLHSAVALQPPYQTTPRRLDRLAHSGTPSPASMPSQRGAEEEDEEHPAVSARCQPPGSQPDSLPANGIPCPRLSPDRSEARRGSAGVGEELPEASRLGPRRVLFQSQPAVVPMTLADVTGMSDSKAGTKPRTSPPRQHPKGRPRRTPLSKTPTEAEEELGEPLSQRTRRNREAEHELHQMSEKLARRLQELDSMLKRALGESLHTSGTREEDKQSHHSDSVMECRGAQRHSDTASTPKSPRARSLSPSPPPEQHVLEVPLEGALAKDLQQYGSEVREPEPQSQRLGKVVESGHEEELKQFEERKRADIEETRGQAQEAERAYREAILQEVPHPRKPSRTYSPKVTPQHRTARARHSTHGRGRGLPLKAAPMKVKENDLLPVLLEELPHLQLSPHTLARMWKQQMKQVDRLAPQPDHRSRNKQANQIEEAQRRHDLLVEIIRKEQEHNQRLRDFKERIQQQKSAQNKLREQRQQVARARKYHNDYHVQFRARLMRARSREERMFKQILEEGLELQKAQLREQRAHAKEQRQEHQRRHRDELASMENYYKDQFSLLAETLAQERHEIQVRKKAQEKALQKMRRELRAKMEREIGELQKIIIQNDDDTFFRELEVERLQERLQMTSFQYRTGHRT
ncbi:centrosomal protein of 95 kDa-like isoform X2 [Brienomyrus brachyistius]|uniref:centrosomal protein of 95 kDa-like isoform X2 n=1 Tax=Brienomyrus brachyistius TaxID=42636 RepID=UPI0020B41558|nr:centrosomal protein of 95 kDa-like isoform X2 [Brienomyrus brachyistius]